jgi:hypothetical protein
MPYKPMFMASHVQSDGVYFHREEGLFLVSRICVDLESMTIKHKRYKTWGLATPLLLEVL